MHKSNRRPTKGKAPIRPRHQPLDYSLTMETALPRVNELPNEMVLPPISAPTGKRESSLTKDAFYSSKLRGKLSEIEAIVAKSEAEVLFEHQRALSYNRPVAEDERSSNKSNASVSVSKAEVNKLFRSFSVEAEVKLMEATLKASTFTEDSSSTMPSSHTAATCLEVLAELGRLMLPFSRVVALLVTEFSRAIFSDDFMTFSPATRRVERVPYFEVLKRMENEGFVVTRDALTASRGTPKASSARSGGLEASPSPSRVGTASGSEGDAALRTSRGSSGTGVASAGGGSGVGGGGGGGGVAGGGGGDERISALEMALRAKEDEIMVVKQDLKLEKIKRQRVMDELADLKKAHEAEMGGEMVPLWKYEQVLTQSKFLESSLAVLRGHHHKLMEDLRTGSVTAEDVKNRRTSLADYEERLAEGAEQAGAGRQWSRTSPPLSAGSTLTRGKSRGTSGGGASSHSMLSPRSPG